MNKQPHQIHSDASTDAKAHIHVNGVTAVLCDLSETRQGRCDGEGEHQHRFQQLGAV